MTVPRSPNLKDGRVHRFAIQPEDFGFTCSPLDAIQVDGPRQRKDDHWRARRSPGPARDIVVLNAGAAISTSPASPIR